MGGKCRNKHGAGSKSQEKKGERKWGDEERDRKGDERKKGRVWGENLEDPKGMRIREVCAKRCEQRVPEIATDRSLEGIQ